MKKINILPLFVFVCITIAVQAQVPSWFSLGMNRYPVSLSYHAAGIGHVCHLYAHPKDSMTMYATTDGGGLWVTHTQGAGWLPLTDSIPAMLRDGCLAINPRYPDSLFYGDLDGIAVCISPDAGMHWYKANKGIVGYSVSGLVIDPLNPNHLVATTSSGIFATFNAGVSWKRTDKILNILDMVMRPTKSGSRVLYAVSYDSFFMSKDFGNTWLRKGVGVGIKLDTAYTFQGLRIGVSQADSMAVCVLAYDGYKRDFGGLYYSKDGGFNFKGMSYYPAILGYACGPISKGGSQGNYNLAVEMHPDSPSTIWVGSQVIWVSRDSGKTWKLSSCWFNGVHEDKHDFLFDPYNHKRLYVAHDGGVDATTDNGLTWQVRSNTLTVSEFYHMGQAHSDREFMAGGLQDNGYDVYKDGDFINLGGGDGYYPYTFNWKGRAYGAQNTYLSRLYKNLRYDGLGFSTNGAAISFSPIDSGLAYIYNGADSSVYISKNVYAIGSSVKWKKISGAKMPGNGAVIISPSPVSPDKAYILYNVVGSQKIYHITNARSATPTITSIAIPSSFYAIYSFACSAQWDSVIYMVATTVSSSYAYGIYRSTNFGKTWKNISSGIPSGIPAMYLLVDYSSKNEAIYFYTYMHVYYRDNTLGKWVPYMKGLPMTAEITKADIYCDSTGKGLLRLSTYGRGIWQVPLYSSKTRIPVADFSALPDLLDCNGMFYINNRSYNDPTSFKWQIFPNTGWKFVNGTTDSSRNPQLQIIKTGTYTLSLEASNATGHGFSSHLLTWSGIAKGDSCIPTRLSGKYPGTSSLSLKFGKDTASIYTTADYYSYLPYFDRACKIHFLSHSGEKIPTSIYGGLSYNMLYIDYNNNGIFEAPELIAKFPTTTSQWKKQIFTIPNKSIVTDTFIRMRLITNNTKITGPCISLNEGVSIDVALFIDSKKPRLSIRADSSVIYGRTKLTITSSEPLQTPMDTSLFVLNGARIESLNESGPLQWTSILRPLHPGKIEILLDSNKVADLAGNFNKDTAYAVLWHELKIKSISFKGQDSLKLDTVSHTISAWLNDAANPVTLVYFKISPKAKLRESGVQILNAVTSFMPKMYKDSLWLVAYDKSDSVGFALQINGPLCHNKNVWQGTVDTAWNNAANWCAGSVPDSLSDIIIPNWVARYPQINAPAFCRDITIDSGATINMFSQLGIYGNTFFKGRIYSNHNALIFAASGPQFIPAGSWENIRAIRSKKILNGPLWVSDSLAIAKGAQINTFKDSIFMGPHSWLTENADSLKPSINGFVKTTLDSPGAQELAVSNIGISFGIHNATAGLRKPFEVIRITGDSAYIKYNYKLSAPGYKVSTAGVSYIVKGLAGLNSDTVYFSLLPIGRKNIDSNVNTFSSNIFNPTISDTFTKFSATHFHQVQADLLKSFIAKSGKNALFFSVTDLSILSRIEKGITNTLDNIKAWHDPSKNAIIVDLNSEASNNLHLSFRDITGKELMDLNYKTLSGQQEIIMPLNRNLSAGIYILDIDGKMQIRKPIIVIGK
jgi:hypothetical protein